MRLSWNIFSIFDISVGKESPCSAGDSSLIPGLGRFTGERIGYPLQYPWASLVAQLGKESPCNAGDSSLIPGSGRSAGERIGYPLHFLGFPCGSAWQRICLQCRRPGFDPWVGKIPWRRERLPTPVFWPGEFHGLYGDTKSWTQLSDLHFHFHIHKSINSYSVLFLSYKT